MIARDMFVGGCAAIRSRQQGVKLRTALSFVLTTTLLPGVAQAQVQAETPTPLRDGEPTTEPKASKLTFEFNLKAAPTIGTSLERGSGNNLVDDSEYRASVDIKRDLGGFSATLSPSVSSSRRYYDDGDPQSALGLQVALESDPLPGTTWDEAQPTRWGRGWFLNYRLNAGYTQFLRQHDFNEHQVTAGLKFTSPAYTLCEDNAPQKRADAAKPYVRPSCQSHGLIGFSFAPELSFVGSDDAPRRRIVPAATLAANGPFGPLVLFGSARIETRLFSDRRAPSGERQADWRLTLDGGVDLARLIQSFPAGVTVKVGGRYVRNYSNAPAERFSRGYFVPSIALALK